MFKDFIKEHEDNVISFVTIAIIVIVLIIVICMWVFNFFGIENEENLNTYNNINYDDTMKEEYTEELKFLLQLRNTDSLYNKMDLQFLADNDLNETNFKSYLLKNNFIGNSIEIISSETLQLNDKYVFRFYYKNYDDYKYVNIIETTPENYTLSFEQESSKITSQMNSIFANSNGIDFELKLVETGNDFVRYNIKITNNNNLDIGIDFNDITTFALVGENINIPVASIVAQDINTLSSNSTINRELYFAISNEMFTECNGLQVNNILINGEYVNVTITF